MYELIRYEDWILLKRIMRALDCVVYEFEKFGCWWWWCVFCAVTAHSHSQHGWWWWCEMGGWGEGAGAKGGKQARNTQKGHRKQKQRAPNLICGFSRTERVENENLSTWKKANGSDEKKRARDKRNANAAKRFQAYKLTLEMRWQEKNKPSPTSRCWFSYFLTMSLCERVRVAEIEWTMNTNEQGWWCVRSLYACIHIHLLLMLYRTNISLKFRSQKIHSIAMALHEIVHSVCTHCTP